MMYCLHLNFVNGFYCMHVLRFKTRQEHEVFVMTITSYLDSHLKPLKCLLKCIHTDTGLKLPIECL